MTYLYVPSTVNGTETPVALFASGIGGNVAGPLNQVMVQLAPEFTLLNVTVPPAAMLTICGPNGVIGL